MDVSMAKCMLDYQTSYSRVSKKTFEICFGLFSNYAIQGGVYKYYLYKDQLFSKTSEQICIRKSTFLKKSKLNFSNFSGENGTGTNVKMLRGRAGLRPNN